MPISPDKNSAASTIVGQSCRWSALAKKRQPRGELDQRRRRDVKVSGDPIQG
jgi:hypothetical protein